MHIHGHMYIHHTSRKKQSQHFVFLYFIEEYVWKCRWPRGKQGRVSECIAHAIVLFRTSTYNTLTDNACLWPKTGKFIIVAKYPMIQLPVLHSDRL